MTADEVLDILETKAKGAFVRELGIYDQEVVEKAKARQEALSVSWRDQTIEVPEHCPDSWIRRIDALDFSSTMRTAFEVKVSRSDWRRESPEKRRAWKAVTHRYIYVSPANVIPVAEVPEDCGLWWIHMEPDVHSKVERMVPRVEVMRKAPKNPGPSDLPWRVALNLCYREQKLRKKVERARNDYRDLYKRCSDLERWIEDLAPGLLAIKRRCGA
jgi:hypothetical protein